MRGVRGLWWKIPAACGAAFLLYQFVLGQDSSDALASAEETGIKALSTAIIAL